MYMTIQHVYDAIEDPEFVGAMTIKSDKYKTSILYGTKIMVIPTDLYAMICMYIKKIRPILTVKYREKEAGLSE